MKLIYLKTFLTFWHATQPDVITGWNIQLFDIPYIITRIRNVLGDDFANMLSPWKLVMDRSVMISGKEYKTFDIFGVSTLDYLDLYKKVYLFGTRKL